MIIDANVYWFPEELFDNEEMLARFFMDIPRGYGTNGKLVERAGKKQIVIERPVGCPGVDYVQGDYTLEGMLAALDKVGIDKAVMKVPCCHEWMSLEICKLFNDGMADYARRSGGRLTPLAVIPPWGHPAQLRELERCHKELGMKGVQLCAHYGNLYLDDPVFAPLFEKLNEWHMTAYVHHTPVPVQNDALLDYNNLRRSYGRCNDQTIAVSREVFSGMFEKYPHVRVVHSMLGGGFFAYLNLMLPPKQKTPDNAGRFDEAAWQMRKYLQNNVYFETSHAQPWGKETLECAVKVLGADHVVYGSSYPVREVWLTEGPAFVQALDLPEEDKAKVLGGNAQKLYCE